MRIPNEYFEQMFAQVREQIIADHKQLLANVKIDEEKAKKADKEYLQRANEFMVNTRIVDKLCRLTSPVVVEEKSNTKIIAKRDVFGYIDLNDYTSFDKLVFDVQKISDKNSGEVYYKNPNQENQFIQVAMIFGTDRADEYVEKSFSKFNLLRQNSRNNKLALLKIADKVEKEKLISRYANLLLDDGFEQIEYIFAQFEQKYLDTRKFFDSFERILDLLETVKNYSNANKQELLEIYQKYLNLSLDEKDKLNKILPYTSMKIWFRVVLDYAYQAVQIQNAEANEEKSTD